MQLVTPDKFAEVVPPERADVIPFLRELVAMCRRFDVTLVTDCGENSLSLQGRGWSVAAVTIGPDGIYGLADAHWDPPSSLTCPYCRCSRVGGTQCKGEDSCCYGPAGGPATCCAGWGSYCCRCGAAFARGQM